LPEYYANVGEEHAAKKRKKAKIEFLSPMSYKNLVCDLLCGDLHPLYNTKHIPFVCQSIFLFTRS